MFSGAHCFLRREKARVLNCRWKYHQSRREGLPTYLFALPNGVYACGNNEYYAYPLSNCKDSWRAILQPYNVNMKCTQATLYNVCFSCFAPRAFLKCFRASIKMGSCVKWVGRKRTIPPPPFPAIVIEDCLSVSMQMLLEVSGMSLDLFFLKSSSFLMGIARVQEVGRLFVR